MGRSSLVLVGLAMACSGEPVASSTEGPTDGSSTSSGGRPISTSTSTTSPATTVVDSDSGGVTGSTGDPPPLPLPPMEVEFLGVGGVTLRVGEASVLTAPLYTNPSLLETTVGSIEPRPEVIDRFLPLDRVEDVVAILVGHAHYDHLMDVPYVWTKTADAMIYGNRSAARLLAGFDEVPPNRVAVLNDPDDPLVDRRHCEDPDPCTGAPAAVEGAWVPVPGAPIRIRALCSTHPAQFLGIIHFGEGCVEQTQAEPLTTAGEWREGATLSYLVDFLDARGAVRYRAYYQDAPAEAPLGLPHPDLLAEHRVDLAILNVGTFDAVPDQPQAAIEALTPRYVIGVHWENFFITQAEPIEPIPFHPDPAEFDERALMALGDDPEAPLVVDGVAQDLRYLRPVPGTELSIVSAD